MVCYHCSSISANPPDQWAFLKLNNPLKGTYTIAHNDVSPYITTANAYLYYTNAAAPDSMPSLGLHAVPNTQCDKEPYMLGTAGCAFPELIPYFTMSLSDPGVAQSAAAVWYGQSHLADHWGANYTTLQGPPLSRVADQASRDANHAAACAGFQPVNPGDTCDEYPFESTYQGAAFVGRDRVYVASVPGPQNSLAGTRLGQFFLYQRVIQDSDFWVAISN